MVKQKVLVIGGNGMIGQTVVQDLRAHGYQITPVDKYPMQKWDTKIVWHLKDIVP